MRRLEENKDLKVIRGQENRIVFFGFDQHRDELLYSNVKGVRSHYRAGPPALFYSCGRPKSWAGRSIRVESCGFATGNRTGGHQQRKATTQGAATRSAARSGDSDSSEDGGCD
jgi:hypothetical protein